MIRRYSIIVIIVMLFVLLIVLQHYLPEPVDWSLNFNGKSKKPYACLVVRKMLPVIFRGQNIRLNQYGLYTSLNLKPDEKENLLIITDSFEPDEYDLTALMEYLNSGNNLFVSALHFSNEFTDTFNISQFSPIIDTSALKRGKEKLILKNFCGNRDSEFHYERNMPQSYFKDFDTSVCTILGTDKFNNPNFLSISVGEGKLYLHSQPLVFTNYHILYGNHEYVSRALSYLPVAATIWDKYYKPGHLQNPSPVRYILSQPPLQAAYYMILISVLIFMVFEGKRKQRAIPVIKPLKNSSLQFIDTIGRLYFNSGNHLDLAKKKVLYFKEFLRDNYSITDLKRTDENIEKIAYKTGVPKDDIKYLIRRIENLKDVEQIKAEQLIRLYNSVEDFYKKSI